MLYIEKNPCPEITEQEIVDLIENRSGRLKEDEVWSLIPGDFSQLPEKERHQWTDMLRDKYFGRLTKSVIREALLKEQHHLCAYCMTPLVNDRDHMKIDHYRPLSGRKENALDYRNFLGVCKGGEDVALPRGRKRKLCCDANKKEASLTIDPQNEEMMKLITYNNEGIVDVKASDMFDCCALRYDIDVTLRLNGTLNQNRLCQSDTTTELVKQRRELYETIENLCLEKKEAGTLTIEFLESKINQCIHTPKREAFVGVKIYVLQSYLNKLLARQNR